MPGALVGAAGEGVRGVGARRGRSLVRGVRHGRDGRQRRAHVPHAGVRIQCAYHVIVSVMQERRASVIASFGCTPLFASVLMK